MKLDSTRQAIREDQALRAARRNARQQRHCLCCRAKFMSDGPGNRLCTDCRRKSTSPYAL